MVFLNYWYINSNIDVWDLEIGLKLVIFILDWKLEWIIIFGNCFVVVKVDKLELLMFWIYIFRSLEGIKFVDFLFKDCLLESVL